MSKATRRTKLGDEQPADQEPAADVAPVSDRKPDEAVAPADVSPALPVTDQAENPTPTPTPATAPAPPVAQWNTRWLVLKVWAPNDQALQVELSAISNHAGMASKTARALDDRVGPVLAAAAKAYLDGTTDDIKGYTELSERHRQLAHRIEEARQRQHTAEYRAKELIRGGDKNVVPPPGVDAITASAAEEEKAGAAKVEVAKYERMLVELDGELNGRWVEKPAEWKDGKKYQQPPQWVHGRRARVHGDQVQCLHDVANALRAEAQAKLEALAVKALETILADNPVEAALLCQLAAANLESHIRQHTTVPPSEKMPARSPYPEGHTGPVGGMGTPVVRRY